MPPTVTPSGRLPRQASSPRRSRVWEASSLNVTSAQKAGRPRGWGVQSSAYRHNSGGPRRPQGCSNHRASLKRRGSRYGEIQKAHSFTRTSGLIPDLVLRLCSADATRWLLIEVKGGPKRGVVDNARAAAFDLLAYRAFAPALDDQDGP